MGFFPDPWSFVFGLETPILELIGRGSALYFITIFFMRILPRRTGGELAMMDLVFVLLVANAAANAFGDFTSISDSVLTIATLVFWDFALNYLSYRYKCVERFVSAPPLQVVRNGKLLIRNMRREFLTKEELMAHLRENGVESLENVKSAYVESEGHVTVILHKS